MTELFNFQEIFDTTGSRIPMTGFIFNLISTAIFSYLTGLLFSEYGSSLSNKKNFSRNFVLIGMTTMLIISVVKSSLALSLGLVGALSIVRFRTAIKEPEELAYLFLLISIGLGFGADQGKIVVAAFFIIATIIVLVKKFSGELANNENLLFTLSLTPETQLNLDKIINILKTHCTMVSLRRFDESNKSLDASFSINIESSSSLSKMKEDILAQDESASISFLDNKDIF